MASDASSRLRTLDLIRGVAVLGILAINVASFAGPDSAAYSPALAGHASAADRWTFALNLLLIEGKMRALFSILFGASLVLFIARKEARGGAGASLQLRRMAWLALIGLLHFALLWDGDILFLYAAVGLVALGLRRAQPQALGIVAVVTFSLWQAWGTASWLPSVAREAAVAAGTAPAAERIAHAAVLASYRTEDQADRTATLSAYPREVALRLSQRGDRPLALLIYNWGETLSYMLIGMALVQSGFFAAAWPRRRLVGLALGGTGLGLLLTLGFILWVAPRGYPELAMRTALGYTLGWPHLLTALGYAALLVLAAPRLLAGALGRRIEAAGQMALTNYLASSLVMAALFSGWGLGWFGQFGPAWQAWCVLGTWLLLLGWSQPWLVRFRHGPIEWLWRSATMGRAEPLRR